MRRILQGLFVAVVAFALSPGALPASQDHGHGKHAGGDKHDPGDRDDRHDNGKHKAGTIRTIHITTIGTMTTTATNQGTAIRTAVIPTCGIAGWRERSTCAPVA